MKKKIYIPLIFIVLISIIGAFTYKYDSDFTSNLNGNVSSIDDTLSKTGIIKEKKATKEEIQNKVDILKGRIAIRDIISRGDDYFQNDQLTLALIKYQDALKKSPQDDLVIEKIGDTFFSMKKFDEASIYFEKLLKYPNFNEDKYLLSILYSTDLTKKEEIESLKMKFNEHIKDQDKKFFYTNLLYCLDDFHLCKKNYDGKVFAENANITNQELKEIKNTVQTYRDFGLVDLYYKDALMIGSFLKLKLYPVAIILGKNLLAEKSDYKSLMQIISQSYFELGDYKNANIYLKKYFDLTPNDSNAAYILGIINLKLHEYILSSIFFNKAMSLGYSESLNLKRKLIYNYYLLENYEKMYSTFDDVIKNEKNIVLDDVLPIINYAMENNKLDKVYEWSKIGITKFSKEVIFYAYIGKLELDKGFTDKASNYFNQGLKINSNNQLLNYYIAQLYIKQNKYNEAIKQLELSLNIEKNNDLSKEIKAEIDKINNGYYAKTLSGSTN